MALTRWLLKLAIFVFLFLLLQLSHEVVLWLLLLLLLLVVHLKLVSLIVEYSSSPGDGVNVPGGNLLFIGDEISLPQVSPVTKLETCPLTIVTGKMEAGDQLHGVV